MDLGLAGRRALVSGSWRGTGAVIAAALAAEGAEVVLHAAEAGQADAVKAELAAAGSDCIIATGDLAGDAGAAAVAAAAGDVDILINNYGGADRGTWEDADSAAWLAMYERNLMSAVRLSRLLSPAMARRGWGRIVNLGTIGSTRPNARMPHYYAAKGALAAMTVSLAKELGPKGITVNLVSPGLIRTPEVEAAHTARARRKGLPEDWPSVERMIVAEAMPNPVGRIATREEVADLVCFLASARAGFLNAQNVRIDGGAVDIVS